MEDARMLLENYEVRVSREINTSSPTPMAEIVVKHFLKKKRHGGSSRAKFVWTHLQASCGKDSSKKFYCDLDGEKYRIGNLGEPTSFLDHVYLGCTQRECKPNETVIDEYRKRSNHEFLLNQIKNCQDGRNLTQKLSRCHTTWKVVRKSALRGIAKW